MIKPEKYLKEAKSNDIYKQLMYLLETMSSASKMVGVRFSVDELDMKKSTTKDFRDMIIKLNTILKAFSENVRTKKQ